MLGSVQKEVNNGLSLRGIDQPPSRVTCRVWAGLQPGPVNFSGSPGYRSGKGLHRGVPTANTDSLGVRQEEGVSMRRWLARASCWGKQVPRLADGRSERGLPTEDQRVEALAAAAPRFGGLRDLLSSRLLNLGSRRQITREVR